MKALCVEPLRYDDELRRAVAAFADVDYVEVEGDEALARAVGAKPYDVLITRLGLRVDARTLAACATLRSIVTPTTGLDHIDIAACEARDVRVLSLRGETAFLDGIRSTAEHTWALLLALCRKIPAAHRDVAAGNWRREPFLGVELSGKTLGVVGCGRLGRMVASYGIAFGMTVIAHDTDARAQDRAPNGVRFVDADALLSSCDVLSLHLQLDEQTKGWLSRSRIALLRATALVINTARGDIVDDAALLEALVAGKVGGVATDVLSGDGAWESHAPAEHAWIRAASERTDLVVTPHIGGYGRDSIHATRAFMMEKLRSATTRPA